MDNKKFMSIANPFTFKNSLSLKAQNLPEGFLYIPQIAYRHPHIIIMEGEVT